MKLSLIGEERGWNFPAFLPFETGLNFSKPKAGEKANIDVNINYDFSTPDFDIAFVFSSVAEDSSDNRYRGVHLADFRMQRQDSDCVELLPYGWLPGLK